TLALVRELSTDPDAAPAEVTRMGVTAANALELTVMEALTLGHNYVGCEHLLLGLVAEPDGNGGRILRARGAESRLVRRAVAAALAGYVHLRNSQAAGTSAISGLPADMARLLATVVREELRPLAERVERLERHVGVPTGE
ncbi:MAG TPA: Clp protease N-terminal domain-containing protein, partial [Micromonospora sp.]